MVKENDILASGFPTVADTLMGWAGEETVDTLMGWTGSRVGWSCLYRAVDT